MGIYHYKSVHVNGTGLKPNTRINEIVGDIEDKLERHADRYRAARSALERLDRGGVWSQKLLVLTKEDLRNPGDEEAAAEKRRRAAMLWRDKEGMRAARLGEGQRSIPWIWRVVKHDARDLPNIDGVATDDDAHKGKYPPYFLCSPILTEP